MFVCLLKLPVRFFHLVDVEVYDTKMELDHLHPFPVVRLTALFPCRTTDAIQNIVFDVNADIEITADERLEAGRRRRLQTGSLVLTFTMKISYRTFSAFLDTATVTDRPFSEDGMRANYIQYLTINNGKTFIGDITSVSP